MESYQCPQHEISYADGHKCPACERDAERARADALAARVDVLEELANRHNNAHEGSDGVYKPCSAWSERDLNDYGLSTPAADLAAHDAKVREKAAKAAEEWVESEEATRSTGPEIKAGMLSAILGKKVAAEELLSHDARVRREALSRACDRLRPMISGLQPEAALALLEAVLGPESQPNEQETK